MNKITLSSLYSRKRHLTVVWVLLSVVLLFACIPQREMSQTKTKVTQVTVTILPTATVTGTLTAVPTASSIPSLTAIIPAIPTSFEPTNIPTKTATPLATATFTAEELRQRWQIIDARIQAIMASNNDCQLPCWWGITPGDTVVDARRIFATIDENGWVDSPFQWGELEGIDYFRHRYRDETGEDIYAGFLVNLRVQGEQVAVFDIYAGRSVDFAVGTDGYHQVGERLTRDWQQFSIRNMFEKFGKPDLIYIMPRSPYYDVNIYYPEIGIAVSYLSEVNRNEQGERTICLDMLDMFNIRSIKLFLYDPLIGLPPRYVQATYPLWPLNPDRLIPEDAHMIELSSVENATKMTIDEFVAFVLENEGEVACFAVE